MSKQIKLTDRAIHLIRCIAKGQVRVFYFSDKPSGWIHLERNGLAVRNSDNSTASLTEKGIEFVKNLPAETSVN